MAGRHFDDWTLGDRIAHEIRRTVTETDNLLFSVMTHNPQPLHIDAEARETDGYREPEHQQHGCASRPGCCAAHRRTAGQRLQSREAETGRQVLDIHRPDDGW